MPQKKKILHLIQSLDNGGCENMLLRTLPLLPDFEHTVITLKEPGELAPKFISVGITVETVHCKNVFNLAGIRRLRETVRNTKPDIIITYLFHADMIGRLALSSVTTAPVIPFLRTTYNHPKYFIARILEWITKPLVGQYLANSEAVKDFYVNHLGAQPERITVIPNGIDTDYFDSILPDPELRTSLGIHPDDFVIICVANLHPNKGHRFLLEAFEQLHISPCHPGPDPGSSPKHNLKLLIVGDGAERKNLEQQVKNYQSKENISFLGRRTDVPQLLKISDCFVLPTLFEGQSNAILEAMAAGVPVITTDIPENRACIDHEKAGFLVQKENSNKLSGAIRKLLIEPSVARIIATQAKDSVKEHHGLTSVTQNWSNFLRSI